MNLADMFSQGNRPKFISSNGIHAVARAVHKQAEAEGVRVVVAGGAAMHLYGSRRMTTDVDFIADRALLGLGEAKGDLTIGGTQYEVEGTEVDVILRADEYSALYHEAVVSAVDSGEGYRVVTPEYLVAIKLAAAREGQKHEDDVLFLLQHVDLDIEATRGIVRRLVGGRFAVDELNSLVAEAEWKKSRAGKGDH